MTNNEAKPEEQSSAYYTVPTPEVTDEEMLGVYEIYRTISHGRTIEPYESLRRERLDANDEVAA